MFLLDTDHLGILQRSSGAESERLSQRLAQCDPMVVHVSIISFHEQIKGWNAYLSRATNSKNLEDGYRRLETILSDFTEANLLSFDHASATVFDELRKQRIRVGSMDLRIAAIALANKMTVLTRNTIDFERVPNLPVEDWTTIQDFPSNPR
jgi:tRNA(fMet)-specific endonuclease VapC